jgi:hypothetical protein
MSGLNKPDAIEGQTMTMLRNDQPAGDTIPCYLLNDLGHSRGCFSGTHDNQPTFQRKQSARYRKHSIGYLNGVVKTGGRIRGM